MNILVVSECFSKGGLETHINTYYEELKKEHNFIFCFGTYTKTDYLKDAKIIDGINLSWTSTISDFCNTVNKLIEVIKEYKIDVIQVHPFYSLFPAAIAANQTNTKIVYTYHGYGSISFTNGAVDTILFQFLIEQFISKIFCVAENAIPWFNKFEKKQAYYIPNLVNENKLIQHNPVKNKTWALISRLDNGKDYEIRKLLSMLPKLDIKKLDIYGSGNQEEDLKRLVKELKLTRKVSFKGYVENLNDNIDNYTGTIGQGRVSLESLCMNYPSILCGYGKLVGVIDENIYNKVKNKNFVPSEFENITIEKLNNQLKEINKGDFAKYQLREKIINDFGINRTNEYIEEINKVSATSLSVLKYLYDDLIKIENKEQSFYFSEEVFKLLQKHFSLYTKNNNLKSIINIYDEIYKNKNISIENNNKVQYDIELINNNLKDINNCLNDVKEFTKKQTNEINELSSHYSDEITKLIQQNKELAEKNEELANWIYRIDNKPNLLKRIYRKIKNIIKK